ncbi:MAG: Holliday junction resolvase RuvX [Candidatus Magasanikbacteria bacterium CG_4_10_14_0_2_um_filter_33_14]|uniref:Putative pre-16S rRNA nuclease n=1 Tax=Candidatus Magasanikbacteria bacterium CG_4_10_14_0_2_um_filter_33_14 TaxID=1974636 RepID=A0A2M7V8H7_9BACT|nr:MAG: Holliday junction resolvase RuvX [Candidatus Magasanikbacteria bacterium CG_4_10_14_0_2_um_filter_33_14]
MNILGIDYGKNKIGLAWLQTSLDIILPFGLVIEKTREEQLRKLAKIIKEENIDKIVFGFPLTLEDMTENKNTERIKKFAEDLYKLTNKEFEFVDERLTTAEARNMEGDASLDEKSAMLILKTYLDK